VFVRRPRYTRQEAAAAAAASQSFSETLRKLGLRPAGGNHQSLRKQLERWGISTAHFDPAAARRAGGRQRATPLAEVLVEHSTFSRGHLKERLYSSGLKERRCEICRQGPTWRGKEMALILDHINGVADDHRLENLRIVCPNCAATLETHCGRNEARRCAHCRRPFRARAPRQRFCSRACSSSRSRPHKRKVKRPPLDRLRADVADLGFSATGRRYGVSGNAIRKWLKHYAQTDGAHG
jgi:hypothetical protein